MNEALATLLRMTEQFMNAHGSAFPSLKRKLASNQELAKQLKMGLRQAIDSGSVSTSRYERLTDTEFESDEEVQDWYRAVWDYLYEDGPEPE